MTFPSFFHFFEAGHGVIFYSATLTLCGGSVQRRLSSLGVHGHFQDFYHHQVSPFWQFSNITKFSLASLVAEDPSGATDCTTHGKSLLFFSDQSQNRAAETPLQLLLDQKKKFTCKLEQALRTRSCVLRIFLNTHKQLGTC